MHKVCSAHINMSWSNLEWVEVADPLVTVDCAPLEYYDLD